MSHASMCPRIRGVSGSETGLTCRQNDVGDHKGRLVGVERPVYLIDGFLDLQCQVLGTMYSTAS